MQNDQNWILIQEILKRSDLLKDVKLILQTNLLDDINNLLTETLDRSSYSIISETNRKVLESFRNLLPEIIKLSLTQTSISQIDLLRFKNLRYLELKNISIKNIKDISNLKPQLCSLTCDNCQDEEFLSIKGKLQWACLNILRFRYRSTIVKLDFLNSMPWLTHLDLSNNIIEENEYLHLPNLFVLNLSFNRLKQIPKLSPECQLKVLLIDHNLITDFKGIECFKNLTTLDISSNFISESSVSLLSFLIKLECIYIKDNLLSIIPNHRCIIAANIFSDVREFKIDGIILDKSEKSFLGRNRTNRPNPRIIQCIDENLIEKPAQILRQKRKSKPKEATIDDLENPQETILTHEKSSFKNEEKFKTEAFTQIKGLEKCDNEIFDINSMEEIGKADELPINVNYSSSPEEPVVIQTTAILHESNTNDEIQSSESDIQPDEQSSSINKKSDNIQSSENDIQSDELQSGSINLKNDEIQSSESDIQPDEQQSSSINLKHDEIQSSESDIQPDEQQLSSINLKNDEIQSSESDETEKNIETSLTQSSISENNSIQNIETHEEHHESISNNPILETTTEITDLNEDGFDSDIDGNEILWHVQLYDPIKQKSQIIFLALLEKTIKERSTITGKSLTKWSLDSIISCVKIKSDPMMVELEFNTPQINKQRRCYIMEYPDAQALMKRVYSILESRTLNDMNQVTYKCKICSTIFVFPKQTESVKCSICGDPDVVEMEEPRLPDTKLNSSINHSPSESSIGSSIDENPKNSSFNSKKYESDVEIISNQSQSSIEVIDDQSRSQSTTPSRKKSNEERLEERLQLTESSSSGSLTESVITAYDNHLDRLESLRKENEKLENAKAVDKNLFKKVKKDIYSYDNFIKIDERIKFYINQNLFSNQNEQLLAFVKSHIWKTGGSDYDGCFVISNFYVYFLSHSHTDFSDESCTWLSKIDTYKLDEMSQMMPIIKNQGVEIKIKNILYFLLLMDDQATDKFILFIKGLNLPKMKIINKYNPKIDTILQQSIINCGERSRHDLDNNIAFFYIFKRILIVRDKVDEEIIRLGGLVSTSEEFFIIPGDLSWLSSYKPPSIHSIQHISRLIEMSGDGKNSLMLRFFDEIFATEEVWNLTLTSSQINAILSVLDK